MKSTQDIVDSIDTRLRELGEEITALNAARSALDASEHEPSRHPSPRTPTRRVHPRTEKRAHSRVRTHSQRRLPGDVRRIHHAITQTHVKDISPHARSGIAHNARRPSRGTAVGERRP